jgi:archaellum component FlaG (FlaF/FlaG flagellin family)
VKKELRTPESKIVIAVAVLLASTVAVNALTSLSVHLDNVVSIKAFGVSVYWDSECNQTASSINWGVTDSGAVKNLTVYIRNEGNAPITLSLFTDNWNPASAANYISLSWSYSGQTVSPNQVLAVTLSLSISSSIKEITSSSFTTTISAIG